MTHNRGVPDTIVAWKMITKYKGGVGDLPLSLRRIQVLKFPDKLLIFLQQVQGVPVKKQQHQ